VKKEKALLLRSGQEEERNHFELTENALGSTLQLLGRGEKEGGEERPSSSFLLGGGGRGNARANRAGVPATKGGGKGNTLRLEHDESPILFVSAFPKDAQKGERPRLFFRGEKERKHRTGSQRVVFRRQMARQPDTRGGGGEPTTTIRRRGGKGKGLTCDRRKSQRRGGREKKFREPNRRERGGCSKKAQRGRP